MLDLDGLPLERVFAELCSALAADGAALYVTDEDGVLELAAASGSTDAEAPPSPWGRLFRRGRPTADVGRELVVAVPDADGALLCVSRKSGEAFTSEDRAIARLYARQLAERVTSAATHVGPSAWTRQLETIQRIAAQLTRLASLDDVGLAICLETKQVIDYDSALIYVLEPNEVDLVAVAVTNRSSAVSGTAAAHIRARMGYGLVGHVAAEGTACVVADAGRDARAARPGALPPGIPVEHESILVAPMHYEGRVTGVIVLAKEGVGRFDDADLRLLQILSDQAAVAVANAHLLAGRDQLVGELQALVDISRVAAEVSDEATLASQLASRLRRLARVDACVISRWEEGSTVLRTLASDGLVDVAPSYDLLDYPSTRAVLREGRSVVTNVDDPHGDPAEIRELQISGARTVLMIPLMARNTRIGIVELFTVGQRREFSEYEINVYRTMANQAGTGLENVRLVEQLRLAADHDQVTGVNNHRYLQERLRQELARSARNRSPLSVLMLDLDRFKPINDKHGHADGDRVLREVAATIKSHVRTNDIVARYGGDEFVVVMPDTPADRAELVAQRVVKGVRSRRHELSDGSQVSVGVSAGLAVYPYHGRTAAALLQAADAAMYTVKRSGGSHVSRLPIEPQLAVAVPREA